MGRSKYQKKSITSDIDGNSPNTIRSDKSDILIGREEELMALKFYMSAAAEGQGSFILINGEAGIGKTHLINAASRIANKEGFIVSEIDFKSYHKYEPYSPFVDLVQKLEKGNSETNQILDQIKKNVVEKDIQNSDEKDYDAELFEKLNSERTILQQIIVTWLLNESKKKPIFLLLNNLHVISQTTFQFIHYLTGKFVDHGIMICAALRQDGEESSKDKIPIYADVVQRMGREGLVTKLHLKRIKKKHLKEYLNQRYKKSDISAKFLDLLYKISDGLPSRFLNYVESLEKQGFLYKRDDIWYNSDNVTKQSVHNLIIDHSKVCKINDEIKELSENRLEILKFAVLIETDFDHQLISELTSQSKISVLRDIEHLKKHKFLQESEDGLFELKHETIRIAVCRLMKENEIQEKNKLIAYAILNDKSILENRKAYLLAKHFDAANESDLAHRYLIISGNIALRNLAFAEAREAFHRALSILDLKSVLLKSKTLTELLLKCAWVDRILGHYKESLTYCKRAHEVIDKTNIELYTNLLLQNGLTLFRLHNWQKSVKCFEECLENETDLSFFNSTLACYGIASVHFQLGNYKQSRKYFERALDEIKRTKNQSFEAEILNNLGAVESVTGNSLKAVARFSESIPIYESIKDDYGLAQVYNNLGLTYADGKKWHDANNCYSQSLAICDRIEIIPLKSIVFLNRAYTLIHLDDLLTAEEYNNKAFRLMERMNDQLGIAEYYKNLGVIKRKKSEWDEAKNNLDKAMEMYQSLDNKLGCAETAYELGLLAFEMNDHVEFENWFDIAIEGCMTIGLNQRVHTIEEKRYKLLTQEQMSKVKLKA